MVVVNQLLAKKPEGRICSINFIPSWTKKVAADLTDLISNSHKHPKKIYQWSSCETRVYMTQICWSQKLKYKCKCTDVITSLTSRISICLVKKSVKYRY